MYVYICMWSMIVAWLESLRMHTFSCGAMELCCCGSCSVKYSLTRGYYELSKVD